MRVELKRIFISDLPETTTREELQNAFSDYGNVKSVEIKERRELGPKNSSLFFSYINLETDDGQLYQCFQDFQNGKLHREYLSLQVARESFLEKLKREREANSAIGSDEMNSTQLMKLPQVHVEVKKQINGVKTVKKGHPSSESINGTESQKLSDQPIEVDKDGENNYIIKNNKGKLKGTFPDRKEPKMIVDLLPVMTCTEAEANNKRLDSINNMKKRHKNKISIIQTALSNVDNKSSNKIIFDEDIIDKYSNSQNENSKNDLFGGNDSDEDYEANFDIREEFQTEEGQKLLQLESSYKNDKRFSLDSRFLNEQREVGKQNEEENNEITLEEEKEKEYEILEQVLGTKIKRKPKYSEKDRPTKAMLRYDPSLPEHSKYEIPRIEKKEPQKRKIAENSILNEKKQKEKDVPVVSKEVYYEVINDLKETLEEKKEFSLLNMFGQVKETKEEEQHEEPKTLGKQLAHEKNPFKYDSTDDEEETIQNDRNEVEIVQTTTTRVSSWRDPFFIKDDDYRLQEGADFVERMKLQQIDFPKLRRQLKEIVRAKMRNNQRKNQPFKKKLGGSKRKKDMRMKKAMKK